jgi:peptidoglycan hydrolase-like protein with peptidoglycan-binding domain
MEKIQTVLEYTGHHTSVMNLGYNDTCVVKLRKLLDKAGIDMTKYNYGGNDNYYDTGIEEAVSNFQKESMGIEPTGEVNDATLAALITTANNIDDIIYYDAVESIENNTSNEGSPHYDSFFTQGNLKTARRNNIDIKIILGDNSVVKTIHNVYMRSVSTEFDTSGNPISEIYEFIAQDLTESDEQNDANKY